MLVPEHAEHYMISGEVIHMSSTQPLIKPARLPLGGMSHRHPEDHVNSASQTISGAHMSVAGHFTHGAQKENAGHFCIEAQKINAGVIP